MQKNVAFYSRCAINPIHSRFDIGTEGAGLDIVRTASFLQLRRIFFRMTDARRLHPIPWQKFGEVPHSQIPQKKK